MSAPYVSIKRLVDNSLAAMLAAVEVYNKPQMTPLKLTSLTDQ